MSLFEAALLGLIQGLTEFLPVSSSGHLVILQDWLGAKEEGSGALFEVILHVGTLLPIVWVFRRPMRRMLAVLGQPGRWTAGTRADGTPDEDAEGLRFVALATLVTVVLVLPVQASDWFERMFESPRLAGFGLLATTALLLVSRGILDRGGGRLLAWQALVVGAAQALAVTPGISRSGSTIVVGLLVGVPLARVGALSFLMSVPVIAGGLVLELARHSLSGPSMAACAVGLGVASVSGYLAVRWTLRCVTARKLWWFAPYTLVLALVVLLFSGGGGNGGATGG